MPNEALVNTILVLGAGELGSAVLRSLSPLRRQGKVGPVSVLLRPMRAGPVEAVERAKKIEALGAAIVEVDLATATIDELAVVFSRYRQIIACTGFVGGPGTQRKITSAVLKAEVDHYIPWQFGVDYDVVGRGSGQDVWDEQLDVRDMLRSQSRVRWTIVSTGMFTSFLFVPEFGVVDVENNRLHALGSWDYRLTVTTPEDIGRLTAEIVTARPECDDRIAFLAGDTFSYRELADTIDRVLDRRVERILWPVSELEAQVAAHPDDVMRKYRRAFARPEGVAWPKETTFNAKHAIAMTDLTRWLRDWRGRQG